MGSPKNLLNLTQQGLDDKNAPKRYGFKKSFFVKHTSLILEALDQGQTYEKVIEALKKDGVEYSYYYFARLVREAKGKESLKKESLPKKEKKSGVGGSQERTGVTPSQMAKRRESNQEMIKRFMTSNPITDRRSKQ